MTPFAHTPAAEPHKPRLSCEADIVLALAATSISFTSCLEEESERWLRVMRLHGQVGNTLQALGVGEAPLEATAQPRTLRLRSRRDGNDPVQVVCREAYKFAAGRGSEVVATPDVLFGVLKVYGRHFDRVLYCRGTTRDELLERLAERVEAETTS